MLTTGTAKIVRTLCRDGWLHTRIRAFLMFTIFIRIFENGRPLVIDVTTAVAAMNFFTVDDDVESLIDGAMLPLAVQTATKVVIPLATHKSVVLTPSTMADPGALFIIPSATTSAFSATERADLNAHGYPLAWSTDAPQQPKCGCAKVKTVSLDVLLHNFITLRPSDDICSKEDVPTQPPLPLSAITLNEIKLAGSLAGSLVRCLASTTWGMVWFLIRLALSDWILVLSTMSLLAIDVLEKWVHHFTI